MAFHPSIVKTYEFGTWAGLYFITIKLLEGRDLTEELRRVRGPLGVRRAMDIAAQGFDGLSAAHAGGGHRDVKPENLFLLNEDDLVKVVDFGVAHTPESNLNETSTGKVVGTPSYIAGLFNEILATRPPPPSAWNPAVPESLDSLVEELLAKDPRDRVPSAAAAAERLRMLPL